MKTLYLEDVHSLVKSFDIAQNVYIGKLDNKKEKSIGIYNLKRQEQYSTALGGEDAVRHGEKSVSFLVHWNKSIRETEKASIALFEALTATKEKAINDNKIKFIIPNQSEPISVGSDDNGIFEYVIEAKIYYER